MIAPIWFRLSERRWSWRDNRAYTAKWLEAKYILKGLILPTCNYAPRGLWSIVIMCLAPPLLPPRRQSQGSSFQQLTFTFVIQPITAIMAYGIIVSMSSTDAQSAATQCTDINGHFLLYTDGRKALFRTAHGWSLAMVGSCLGSAGVVESEVARFVWTVFLIC
jgi:hypothetical protein